MIKIAAWFLLILAVLFALGFCTMLAHGSVAHRRPNSLGVSPFYTNTNTYLFAVPIDAQRLDGVMVIRFQPYNTMELYDESVLFCGDVSNFFLGKSGPMVITYDRVGHRLFRGLACHDIVSVFEVHDDQKVVLP
jgi:hypothetical protein